VVWAFEHDGVLVPPGTYTARLNAGERTVTRSFALLIDPRVAADGVTVADLEEQYEVTRAIGETMARAQEVSARIRQRAQGATGEARQAFQTLEARMVDDAVGSYPQPMFLNQIRYLYSMLQRADQKPGQDAYARHAELQAELVEIVSELERLERIVTDGAGGGSGGG
jgi:hypothetical protein